MRRYRWAYSLACLLYRHTQRWPRGLRFARTRYPDLTMTSARGLRKSSLMNIAYHTTVAIADDVIGDRQDDRILGRKIAANRVRGDAISGGDLIDRRGFVPLHYAEIEGDIDHFFAVVLLRHDPDRSKGPEVPRPEPQPSR
jgi:hypothetical protein